MASNPPGSRSHKPWLVMLIVAVTACFIGPIQAAQAATDVYHEHIRGLAVLGTSSSGSADGCLETGAYLFSDKTTTSYQSYSYNYCTEVYEFVYGTAAPTTFKVTGNLASAHVVATIALVDLYTGQSAGQITVDETFTANAAAETSTYAESDHVPGEYLLRYRVSMTSRSADATGTLTFNDYAAIGKGTSATVRITQT